MQDGQKERADSQHCGIAISCVQSHRIAGIITFKIINNFPQKYGLNYFGAFLKEKEKAFIRSRNHTKFSQHKHFFYQHMKKAF
jgi:hypothetical protein